MHFLLEQGQRADGIYVQESQTEQFTFMEQLFSQIIDHSTGRK